MRGKQVCVVPHRLRAFSEPRDREGYADSSISNDMVTEVYLEFSARVRIQESEKYLRTLPGMLPSCCRNKTLTIGIVRYISMDATFGAANKGTVCDSKGKRHVVGKGGVLNLINENSEIIAWVRPIDL